MEILGALLASQAWVFPVCLLVDAGRAGRLGSCESGCHEGGDGKSLVLHIVGLGRNLLSECVEKLSELEEAVEIHCKEKISRTCGYVVGNSDEHRRRKSKRGSPYIIRPPRSREELKGSPSSR